MNVPEKAPKRAFEKPLRIPASTQALEARQTSLTRRIVVPVQFMPEDILVPNVWADIYRKVNLDDEVIVCREDRAFRLHLLVVEVGVGYVKTIVLHRWERADLRSEEEATGNVDISPPAGYTVNFAPRTKWRVFTIDPHLEISRDHASKEVAIKAAIDHAKHATAVAA